MILVADLDMYKRHELVNPRFRKWKIMGDIFTGGSENKCYEVI